MAKNIDFKGLLNTVPYFCIWGNVLELLRNMWVDSGDLGQIVCEWVRECEIRGNGDKMGID